MVHRVDVVGKLCNTKTMPMSLCTCLSYAKEDAYYYRI